MSEFIIIAIVAVSALVGVSGVLIYLLLGTIRARASPPASRKRKPISKPDRQGRRHAVPKP